MSSNATLIDGPLEGRTVNVEEESSNDPPSVVEVDGELYVCCGFSGNTTRSRHQGGAAS